MIFEFLLACNVPPGVDTETVRHYIVNDLTDVLYYSEVDFDNSMIQIRHERIANEVPDDDYDTLKDTVIGFFLELPDDAIDNEDVVTDFTEALQDNPFFSHIVKFEDPLLRAELAERADEIFVLEMKLRRVLSLMYLNAYQLRDPFDLLRDEHVRMTQKEPTTEGQMKESAENQFFHITFSQYISLNKRRQPHLDDIIRMISNSEQYDSLREELVRNPIENEYDTDLLSDLKTLMDPIEQMRNCVAHNRKPTKRIKENYSTTRPRLEERLDRYLADFEVSP